MDEGDSNFSFYIIAGVSVAILVALLIFIIWYYKYRNRSKPVTCDDSYIEGQDCSEESGISNTTYFCNSEGKWECGCIGESLPSASCPENQLYYCDVSDGYFCGCNGVNPNTITCPNEAIATCKNTTTDPTCPGCTNISDCFQDGNYVIVVPTITQVYDDWRGEYDQNNNPQSFLLYFNSSQENTWRVIADCAKCPNYPGWPETACSQYCSYDKLQFDCVNTDNLGPGDENSTYAWGIQTSPLYSLLTVTYYDKETSKIFMGSRWLLQYASNINDTQQQHQAYLEILYQVSLAQDSDWDCNDFGLCTNNRIMDMTEINRILYVGGTFSGNLIKYNIDSKIFENAISPNYPIYRFAYDNVHNYLYIATGDSDDLILKVNVDSPSSPWDSAESYTITNSNSCYSLSMRQNSSYPFLYCSTDYGIFKLDTGELDGKWE